MPRYTIEQRSTYGEQREWLVSFNDMAEDRARATWAELHPNGRCFTSDIEFRWRDGIAPPGLRTETTPSCEHCGLTRGAHAYPTELCPTEGGWAQRTFTYRDPGHRSDHDDSVCQVCDQRREQHRQDWAGRYVCRAAQWSSRPFTPYNPTLVRRRNPPEVVTTQPMMQGTFAITSDDLNEVCRCTMRRGQHSGATGVSCPEANGAFSPTERFESQTPRRFRTPSGAYYTPGVGFTEPPRQNPPEEKSFDFHSLPHLSEFANIVNKLAGELYRTTGRKQPLKAIVLERDMMLSMGIPGDTVMQTATGPVKIRPDRPLDSRIRGLRADAVFVDEAQALPPSAMLFGVDRTEAPRVQPAPADGIEARVGNTVQPYRWRLED